VNHLSQNRFILDLTPDLMPHLTPDLIPQGWAQNVKARDRDETETLTSQDRYETETRRL